MLSAMVMMLLGGAVLGYVTKDSVNSIQERKRRNSKYLLEESNKRKEEESFFEQFFLSFQTDSKWRRHYTGGKKGINVWVHENGLECSLSDFTLKTRNQWYAACVYRKDKDIANAPLEVLHTFTDEEMERIKSYLRSKELEQLNGF